MNLRRLGAYHHVSVSPLFSIKFTRFFIVIVIHTLQLMIVQFRIGVIYLFLYILISKYLMSISMWGRSDRVDKDSNTFFRTTLFTYKMISKSVLVGHNAKIFMGFFKMVSFKPLKILTLCNQTRPAN